ncbi:MAG: outer membrane protein assembly factor BamD [Bacteroidales bacterium]|nr:outer membrane protein assembly factor BamD [Bacteroidales bacterium]
MFTSRRHTGIISVILTFAVSSCSQYAKILKSDDVDLKASMAVQYFNDAEYTRAAMLFDQLSTIVRGTQRADSVFFYQAMTSYHQYDYYVAASQFNSFVQVYGNSIFAEDAAFMEAYCYYMNSPRPELDQTETNKAIETLQLFMIRYPDSPKISECQRMILELREKLMEKSFLAAELYYNLGNYKASITALNHCLSEFPDTKYRENILFRLLKSRYLYAINSVPERRPERYQETIDEYYSFIAEFPESENRKEAENIYDNASNYVEETDEMLILK